MIGPNLQKTIYISDAKEAYDKAAPFYDDRDWMKFWINNEVPLIMSHLSRSRFERILEIGSGTGLYTTKLVKMCRELVAVDPSKGMSDILESKLPVDKEKLKIINIPWPKNNFKEETFDLVFSSRTLCSINDINGAIHEILRVAKRGGTILLCDLHPDYNIEYCTLKNKDSGLKIKIPFYKHNLQDIHKILQKACSSVQIDEIYLEDFNYLPLNNDSFKEAFNNKDKPLIYLMKAVKS